MLRLKRNKRTLEIALVDYDFSKGTGKILKTWEASKESTAKKYYNRKLKEEAMESIGLTKVIGAVSGKVYWE